MSFQDHFSSLAAGYAKYRPGYPEPLFDWLAEASPAREAAWDAGCGSGQASLALAERFARVVATDGSAAQIENATPHPRVTYRVRAAEDGPGEEPDGPVDLVTVAQALHWFDLPRFWEAVRRAARPGALFAAFSYGPVRTDSREVNHVLKLFDRMLHERRFWPEGRKLVDEGYASVALPFAPVEAPELSMAASWSAADLLSYVDTWSALARLREAGADGLRTRFHEDVARAWGDPASPRGIRWPLAVRAGRV